MLRKFLEIVYAELYYDLFYTFLYLLLLLLPCYHVMIVKIKLYIYLKYLFQLSAV